MNLEFGSVGMTVIFESKGLEFKSRTSHQMEKKSKIYFIKYQASRNGMKIPLIFFVHQTTKFIARVEEISDKFIRQKYEFF
jgi:hypothetical protein